MRTKHLILAVALLIAAEARPFCGFYVAKADATLFNDRSEVILVRDGRRTVITMSNDFKGNVRDFAMVVPVPTILGERDIRVLDRTIFQQLDAYSSPRLVEYYDENPCMRWEYAETVKSMSRTANMAPMMEMEAVADEADYGVTIEAEYTIGEYDILILSATESKGLKTWLIQNGYKIPSSAEEVLEPYIKSELKFFVVKVNLDNMNSLGYEFLRPIQVEFESDKFMLPIRLGMANSRGEQDMIVYAFTRTGRVEAVNYRTVKAPTDRNVPLFVKERFGEFYKDLFKRTYEREGRNAVFTEYAWNVTPSWGGMKCDPCVGPPPMPQEFANAGVNWSNGQNGQQVFFTRLHVRYSRDRFPQDIFFQVTPDQQHYQARYVLTHPAKGDLSCSDGQSYLETLYFKRKRELDELSSLTGWDVEKHRRYAEEVKGKMNDQTLRKLNAPWAVPVKDTGTPGGPTQFLLIIGICAVGIYLTTLWWQRKLSATTGM